MKNSWKISFWISIVILLISNLFWMYQMVDNAIGTTYYKDSCDNYQNDMFELKKILDGKLNKESTIKFLEQNKVVYDSFTKGKDFIIQLNSFDMTFNANGQLIYSETY